MKVQNNFAGKRFFFSIVMKSFSCKDFITMKKKNSGEVKDCVIFLLFVFYFTVEFVPYRMCSLLCVGAGACAYTCICVKCIYST